MSNIVAASALFSATVAAVRGDKVAAVAALLGDLAQLYANNGSYKVQLQGVSAGIREGRKSIAQNTLAGRALEALAAIEAGAPTAGARPAKGLGIDARDAAAEAFALGIVSAFEGVMHEDNEARKAKREAHQKAPKVAAPAPATSEGEEKAREALSATVKARDKALDDAERMARELATVRAELAAVTLERDALAAELAALRAPVKLAA